MNSTEPTITQSKHEQFETQARTPTMPPFTFFIPMLASSGSDSKHELYGSNATLKVKSPSSDRKLACKGEIPTTPLTAMKLELRTNLRIIRFEQIKFDSKRIFIVFLKVQ
jgi:hypothetical protein